MGLVSAVLDRLMLDKDRIGGIVSGLRAVAGQTDPIGEVIEMDSQMGLISVYDADWRDRCDL